MCMCVHIHGWMNKPVVQTQEKAWGSVSHVPTAILDLRHQTLPQDLEIQMVLHIPRSYCRWKGSCSR